MLFDEVTHVACATVANFDIVPVEDFVERLLMPSL